MMINNNNNNNNNNEFILLCLSLRTCKHRVSLKLGLLRDVILAMLAEDGWKQN